MAEKPKFRVYRPQAMLNTLKRLNGHNLENQGLNNLTEAFQNFMTRTRFFAMGSLRRTWSHSAVEFMKYRRLLPMLVADESDLGSAFDSFDLNEGRGLSSRKEDRRILVSNISPKATVSQLQSFFNKFGPVYSCHMPSEDRRQSMYATFSRSNKKYSTLVITFKDEISALRAKTAAPQELKFYGQIMTISNYVSRKRTSSQHGDSIASTSGIGFTIGSGDKGGKLSRSSSACSMESATTISSQLLPLDELPPKAVERIFCNLGLLDRIRLERTNKTWLEAAAKAWTTVERLCFHEEEDLQNFFTNSNPLRNSHLNAFLLRCCFHLKCLDLSNTKNLLDDKAIEQIAQFCINLEELDISGVQSGPNALRSLSESLSKLHSVAYREMHSSSEKCFWYLFKSNGRSIRRIDLRGCSHLKGRCFKLFGAELEEVLLDGCSRIDDSIIDELCARSKNLKVLRLNGCYRLTEQALSVISRNQNSLEHFSLAGQGFNNVTADSLALISRIKAIKHLELDFNPAVSDFLIQQICENLPGLKSLSLGFSGSDQSITSESLQLIANLKDLEELDFSGLAALDNKTFEKICSGCKKLKEITVRSCIYLGDAGTGSVKGLELLESVDLSGCILVTTVSIQEIISHFTHEKNPNGADILLIVGGTLCENKLRYKNSRVHVDFDDNSALSLNTARKFIETFQSNDVDTQSDGEFSDDGFGMLSAHRSFVADALTGEEESPLENDNSIIEWAEKEAKELGLLK
ncbi:unnamed protein product [Bursaphelenchus xylophilus]|uniref:(pine wood nematode) hypothetical protein n=1 Tax=Bursaphelenchus xylophilus TaxID=6326 RepID=A0A1I7RPS2_BURXY|nr:unnamed protein product [Bursaphelenchus xylophilus]CAG9096524.1 unnamed protein product [Bursaphelenchus xylophilus]